MTLRLHAIIMALNEEIFIENQLRTLYSFCSGISILTQILFHDKNIETTYKQKIKYKFY